MTLTTVQREVDRMSLFQDLKLKRRKVDSRCSSDESVADTSTSSPDSATMAPGEGSPKAASESFRSSPSPSVPRDRLSPDSAVPSYPVKKEVVEQEEIIRPEVPPLKESGDNSVFDGGGQSLKNERYIEHANNTQPQQTQLQQQQQQQLQQQHQLQQQQHQMQQQQQQQQQQQPAQQQQQQQQQQEAGQFPFWPGSFPCRINGVRPELISGGFVNGQRVSPVEVKSVSPSLQKNGTPTVIMGEAGGVRTMVWSHPGQNVVNLEHPQHSNASSVSSVVGDPDLRLSVDGLLRLGQDPRITPSSGFSPMPSTAIEQQIPTPEQPRAFPPVNMEMLWAGDLSQLPPQQPDSQALNLTAWNHRNGAETSKSGDNEDEDDQPMICMICEDKATGLHYGIITCEGCKGFFKRTVQNRRVYTCVADGNCEITKAQRNRCQYCRFKKCIEQGMVLQAVREDRMPGGRNSGAVYNLYKVPVKYKKHKKNQKNGQLKTQMDKHKTVMNQEQPMPHLVNGEILKTALTNPSEIVHLRQRLENTVSSSRDRNMPIETAIGMIQTLIDCDEFQDIATLRNMDELLDHESDLSEKLCQIGDSIVYKLVQWTKRLPFYLELPVEVHTRLLTHKWHELLVLTTSAYQAIHGAHKLGSTSSDGTEADFHQEVSNNLCTLQTCLTSMMGRPITMDQLRQDVGLMVEKITHVTLMFRRLKLQMEEYVCLKVITMLNQGRGSSAELESIQERYMACLRSFVEHNFHQQPSRFQELLVRLPEVQSAAALLLESKMFYVPFLLNSAIQR